MNDKISLSAFNDAVLLWMKAGGKDGTHQRLGQFLINVFFNNLAVSSIFYEEDWKKAYVEFFDLFVVQD